MERLEKEIEEVLKNRISTAEPGGRYRPDTHQIINIGQKVSGLTAGNAHSMRLQSAAGGKRNLMSAAYKHKGGEETNNDGFNDDIYEDEESSDEND